MLKILKFIKIFKKIKNKRFNEHESKSTSFDEKIIARLQKSWREKELFKTVEQKKKKNIQ